MVKDKPSRKRIKLWPQWHATYQSDPLTGRDERRMAKQDLKRGLEPLPEYRTGRFWVD